MKRTQRKDAVRNITRQKVSYISIVIIAMMAVTAYLGISYASAGLYAHAARFYDRLHFRDAEVVSTQLLSADDLAELRATEGVADVEGVYTVNSRLVHGSDRKNVSVVSLTERINTVDVKEGRLPEHTNECVLEQELAAGLKIAVGDRIRICGSDETPPEYLQVGDFTVVGIVLHPDLYGMPVAQIGDRYVLVPKDAFDRDALEGCYMKAEVLYEKADGISVYDDGYLKDAKVVTDRLNEKKDARAALRSAEVRKILADKIEDGQRTLDDGKAELVDARKTLDEKTQELLDGEQKLKDGEVQLRDAEEKLADGKKQLEDGEKELTENRQKLDDAKAQLDEARAELDDAKAQLADARQQLIDGYAKIERVKTQVRNGIKDAVAAALGQEFCDSIEWASPSSVDPDKENASASRFRITKNLTVTIESLDSVVKKTVTQILKGTEYESRTDEIIGKILADARYQEIKKPYARLTSGIRQWNSAHKQYIEALHKYQDGEAQYQEGLEQYNEGERLYAEGLETYQKGLAEYEEKRKEFEDARQQLADGRAQLEEGRKLLSDGEAEYAEAVLKYEDGVRKLDAARERLSKLDDCRWVVLDVSGNVGYYHAQTSARNISRIGMTFSLLFVLVGALVIYATVGRMVEEQRKTVGTTKALGFFNREILLKYLTFGLSATLIGVVLGIALGYFVIEKIVLVAHQTFYVDGTMPRAFQPVPTAIVAVLAAVLSAVSVWTACASLVRSPARELMQERVPKAQKKTKKRTKSRLSLYSRLILRNVRSDKKRVIVTVVSIAGCCTLLLIGFTLYYGITTAISRQFGDITRYEQTIRFDPDVETAKDEITGILDAEGLSAAQVRMENLMAEGNGETSPYLVIAAKPDAIGRYFTLRDAETGEPFVPAGEGIYIHKRMSETKGLKTGDAVTLYDAKMNPHAVRVAGVFNNYFGTYAFLSEEGYAAAFGDAPTANALWIAGCPDPEALKEKLSPIAGYDGTEDLSEQRKSADQIGSILTLVTGVLILCAGMMAYFILLNLTGMYLMQKQRELTVMRINGFTTKEVIRYVSRETVFTTALGIVFGLGLGALMGWLILRFLEQDHVQFVRTVTPVGMLLAAGITVLFTACINAIALRKVRNLKLTDL